VTSKRQANNVFFMVLGFNLKCKYNADKLIRTKKSEHCARLMKMEESKPFFAFKIQIQI
jgi:hypothetical protein